MCIELFGHEMSLSNGDFFIEGIAGHMNCINTVEQWLGYCVQGVGRCNEDDSAEIDRHIQVMVFERVILLRV